MSSEYKDFLERRRRPGAVVGPHGAREPGVLRTMASLRKQAIRDSINGLCQPDMQDVYLAQKWLVEQAMPPNAESIYDALMNALDSIAERYLPSVYKTLEMIAANLFAHKSASDHRFRALLEEAMLGASEAKRKKLQHILDIKPSS